MKIQPERLESQDPSLASDSEIYRTRPPDVGRRLDDSAVGDRAPYSIGPEVRGISISMAFTVFLFGIACGSIWASLLFWFLS